MLAALFLHAAAVMVAFWGAMHLVKTKPVVAGFEPLSADNRHVLTMEWVLEGVTLCFIAALVFAMTVFVGHGGLAVTVVYVLAAAMLLTMAVVSLFTGARASPLPYKLCAPIFTTAAALILLGGFVA
jgi:hypothetical protein